MGRIELNDRIKKAKNALDLAEKCIIAGLKVNKVSDEWKQLYVGTLYDVLKSINEIRARL